MHPRWRWALRLVLVTLILLQLIAVVGEYGLRARARQQHANDLAAFQQRHPDLGDPEPAGTANLPVGELEYYWDCYVGLRYVPNQRVLNKTINRNGYHDRDWETPKPAGAYRIVLMGGSLAEAGADSETLGRLLQERLSPARAGVEVLNCGLTGMMSTQERILFFDEVLGFAPDLVVFVNGVNELSPLRYHLTPGQHFYWAFGQYGLGGGQSASRLLRNLLTKLNLALIGRSYLYAALADAAGVETSFNGGDIPDATLAAAVDKYYANMEVIRTVASARGIKTIHFLQPLLFEKPAPSVEELFVIETTPPNYRDFYRRGYLSFNQRADDRGYPLRFTKLLAAHPDRLFSDPFHFVLPRGNQLLAEAMSAEIMRVW